MRWEHADTLSVMVNSFNPKMREAEAGRSLWVLVQPGLQSKFHENQEKFCLKHKHKNKKQKQKAKPVQKLWKDNNEKLSTILKLRKTNSGSRVFLYISRKGPSINYLNYKMVGVHFIHCECTVQNFPKHQCTCLCLLKVLSKTIFLLLEQNVPSYLREV